MRSKSFLSLARSVRFSASIAEPREVVRATRSQGGYRQKRFWNRQRCVCREQETAVLRRWEQSGALPINEAPVTGQNRSTTRGFQGSWARSIGFGWMRSIAQCVKRPWKRLQEDNLAPVLPALSALRKGNKEQGAGGGGDEDAFGEVADEPDSPLRGILGGGGFCTFPWLRRRRAPLKPVGAGAVGMCENWAGSLGCPGFAALTLEPGPGVGEGCDPFCAGAAFSALCGLIPSTQYDRA